MPLLSESEFKPYMSSPMEQLSDHDNPPFDFWPYFDEIPIEDFEGADCSEGAVDYVWRTPAGEFQHVLVSSADSDEIFMAIVLDVSRQEVIGHRLLDMKREYRIQ